MKLTNGKFSSLYLVEQINVFREVEGSRAKLMHYDLLKKIEKEFEEEINDGNISVVNYKDKKGELRKSYELDYKQSVQILVSESRTVRKAVINRIEELEKQLRNQPKYDYLTNTRKLYNRFLVNKQNIPAGYFSMIEATVTMVVMPLESDGKDLIEEAMPDSSLGRGFCKFLRNEKGIDTSKLPTYLHRFENGKIVKANLYKDEHLADFKRFVLIWAQDKGKKYFTEKIILLLNK